MDGLSSQAQAATDGVFDLKQGIFSHPARGSVREAFRVERAKLKAEESGFHRQSGLTGRYAHVDWVVSGDVLTFGADDDRHDQWLRVYLVNREHEHRTLPCLLATDGWVQVDEVDVPATYGHQFFVRPSDSVAVNSRSMA